MSVRTLIVLALAVVCGGTSAAGVYLMGGRTKTEDPKTVSIVVATGSIARGTVVSEKTIALRE